MYTVLAGGRKHRAETMKTTIQKNKTTILRTHTPSEGFVVATITAGTGLSHDLQSSTGERRSELLVHNKVFKTFRDPRLAKLFFNILEAGEVNTDHWRRPSQEGGDWFLLKEWHTLQADKLLLGEQFKVDENKEILLAIHGN
tara:strand:- start:15021 stop:15446 length:426 start_codon:yes stop_codon:yes gene_type:complete